MLQTNETFKQIMLQKNEAPDILITDDTVKHELHETDEDNRIVQTHHESTSDTSENLETLLRSDEPLSSDTEEQSSVPLISANDSTEK